MTVMAVSSTTPWNKVAVSRIFAPFWVSLRSDFKLAALCSARRPQLDRTCRLKRDIGLRARFADGSGKTQSRSAT